MKIKNKKVAVFGAYGHTGNFVVGELIKRGFLPVLIGRDKGKLMSFGAKYPNLEMRVASTENAKSLDRALTGTEAVINCAGPFLDTAVPLVEAAIRSRIHYLDVTAEQTAVKNIFENFAEPARNAGISVVPAAAFFGGLADLLATAAMNDWTEADEIKIAVALDSWHPTEGTRTTGKRNTARRLVVSNKKSEFLSNPPPTMTWDFPPPFANQDVVELPFSEIITVSSHLQSSEIHSFINLAPLTDIRNPNTPHPKAVDENGRSKQIFLMDVIVKKDGTERRMTATGQDIYAISAPIVVEAVSRILDNRFKRIGVGSMGDLFDAAEVLMSLSPGQFSLETNLKSG